MSKPILLVLIGLPASGKTTYASTLLEKDLNWRRINWDEARRDRGMLNQKFNRKTEDAMQQDSFAIAEKWGREGFNVVIDNTNLTESTRNKWKGVAQRAEMDYQERRFDLPVSGCVERDSYQYRENKVGRAVIERMALWAGLINFDPFNLGDTRYLRKDIVIVDVDGTLADCSHRQHYLKIACIHCGGAGNFYTPMIEPLCRLMEKCKPCNGRGFIKDHDAFFSCVDRDAPIQSIITLTRTLYHAGYLILIVSGRPIDRAGKATVAWLEEHKVPYHHIFMRAGGDRREDSIVKFEILNKLPKDRIQWVIDDRKQVVDMWRENGLTCLQCAAGDF